MNGGHEINLHDFVLFCTDKMTSDKLCSTREQLSQTALVRLNMFAIGKLASHHLCPCWTCGAQMIQYLPSCTYIASKICYYIHPPHMVSKPVCVRPLTVPLPVAAKKIVTHLRCSQPFVAKSAVNIQAKKEATSWELRRNQHIFSETIGTWKHLLQVSKGKHNYSSKDDNDKQASEKKIQVRGAPRARILLENMTTCHDMLQQVPLLERQKEVATRLREGYSEK
jgi:hypothetical protein